MTLAANDRSIAYVAILFVLVFFMNGGVLVPYVKQWIEENGDEWYPRLYEKYRIGAVEDSGLVSLKYNQIESPMHEPIVQECRGMVVDLDTRQVVCHPYNKFWNLGESLAAPIDWGTARVQDKLDGSLMLLYFHGGQWQVASSGSPRAGGSYGVEAIKFADKFWQVFYANGMILPETGSEDVGFFFELCAPDNRIVVVYEQAALILHGARDRVTENEMSRGDLEKFAARHFWPIVNEHPLRTPEEVDAAVKALDPVKSEGFIVVDDRCRRVKIKSPRYVALHHLRDRTTPSAVIALWKAGEVDELLSYFPEHRANVTAMVCRLETACRDAFEAYRANRDAPTRREYAEAVKGRVWSPIAFRLLDNKSESFDDALAILRASLDVLAEKILEAR